MSFQLDAAEAPAFSEDNDTPPEFSEYMMPDDDKAPDVKICASPGCHNEVERTPTGRKGKYCAEHKGSRTGASTGTRTSRTGWKKAPEVQAALMQLVNGSALLLQFVNPVDAGIVRQGGPNIVTALIDLARDDKTLQRYLEWLATPGKYGPLLMATMGVAIPIAVNHNMLPSLDSLLGSSAPNTERKTQ